MKKKPEPAEKLDWAIPAERSLTYFSDTLGELLEEIEAQEEADRRATRH